MLHSRLLFPVLQVLLHRMRMWLDIGSLILELYNLQLVAVRTLYKALFARYLPVLRLNARWSFNHRLYPETLPIFSP